MGRSPRGALRRRTPVVGGAFLAVVGGAVAMASGVPAPASAASRAVTVVVSLRPGAEASSVVRAAGLAAPLSAVSDATPGMSPARYVIQVSAADTPSVVSRLRGSSGVSYAEVAHRVHATATPNDPCDSTAGCLAADDTGATAIRHQDYLNVIGAPAAWDISKGAGVTVAVLDSGVDAGNQDLQGKIVAQHNICAADPECADGTSGDDAGHGTHVTGILAANTNNGYGVASLGWDVKVDEYKVLNSTGGGNTADVATAIYDAVAAGDRVINMSLANFSCAADPTDCGPDPDEGAAVEYAIAHNVVVVAAAGNDGYNSAAYPASYPGVLAVASTDNSGAVQPFSQWGQAANIAAPGVDIVSTWPDGTVYNPGGSSSPCQGLCVQTGTSMSTPQVAAAAALLISHAPGLTGPQVTQILEATARTPTGGHPIYGGVVNVPAALAGEAKAPTAYNGYEMAASNGSVYSFGGVGYFGDASSVHLTRPVVGTAVEPNGLGYWLVASDGGIFTYGQANFYGSTGAIALAKPIVGMAPTPDGRGYWLVASDGGVFSYGNAGFYGSTGAIALAKPVVGMAPTPDGRGYWLVASDGGIFAFGDAGFYGSTGSVALARPIVGMAPSADGRGYWLVASDGGIFAFGDAGFYGSTGSVALARPIVGMAPSADGRGYWLVASDGGVFAFGDARFYGSTGGIPIAGPVTAVAS